MSPQSAKITGIIPARFGSTRFPGKPLTLISGKTLIQHTYENAKKCEAFDSLIVATDDVRIYDHVTSFGATAVMTSPSCPTGTDRIVEVVSKQPVSENSEIIVNIQGDEPLVEEGVIKKLIQVLKEDPQAVMSTPVCAIQSESDAFDPAVVKCVFDRNLTALYFSRALIPSGHTKIFDKQTLYYQHIGVYAFRREFLLNVYPFLPDSELQNAEDLEMLRILEAGFKIKIAVVLNQNIGVNTPEDIKKVEHLLC